MLSIRCPYHIQMVRPMLIYLVQMLSARCLHVVQMLSICCLEMLFMWCLNDDINATHCLDVVDILSRCYLDVIQMLSSCCLDVVQMLFRCCEMLSIWCLDIVQTMSICCLYIVKMVSRQCLDVVQTLSGHCLSAYTLSRCHQCHADDVLTLPRCCLRSSRCPDGVISICCVDLIHMQSLNSFQISCRQQPALVLRHCIRIHPMNAT